MNAAPKPWVRYSLIDGVILEISMQKEQEFGQGEAVFFVERELAEEFISGKLNAGRFLVSLSGAPEIVARAEEKNIRCPWYLDDVTNGSGGIELIKKSPSGLTIQRTDDLKMSMVIYVTMENDPNVLLVRSGMDEGQEKQKLSFNTTIPYSIYVRRYVA